MKKTNPHHHAEEDVGEFARVHAKELVKLIALSVVEYHATLYVETTAISIAVIDVKVAQGHAPRHVVIVADIVVMEQLHYSKDL